MKRALALVLVAATAHAGEDAPPTDKARAAVQALDARDFGALARLVDGERGLGFSAFLCEPPRVTLTAAEVARLPKERALRTWGAWAGSGKPIRMRFSRYFARFVYDRRFAAQKAEAWPQEKLRCPGDAKVALVRFFVPGETTWRALYLGFVDGKLVSITHDEWTV